MRCSLSVKTEAFISVGFKALQVFTTGCVNARLPVESLCCSLAHICLEQRWGSNEVQILRYCTRLEFSGRTFAPYTFKHISVLSTPYIFKTS